MFGLQSALNKETRTSKTILLKFIIKQEEKGAVTVTNYRHSSPLPKIIL